MVIVSCQTDERFATQFGLKPVTSPLTSFQATKGSRIEKGLPKQSFLGPETRKKPAQKANCTPVITKRVADWLLSSLNNEPLTNNVTIGLNE